MLLNKEQNQAVYSNSPLIAVIAAAGSGKTYTLIERIYRLVKENIVNPATIKPITFTRKAAGELRDRLEKLEVTGVRADTFHSFCFNLINGYATRLGYRFPVNAYDEYLSSSILVDILISHSLPDKNPIKNERLRTASLKTMRSVIEKIYLEKPDEWIQIDEEYKHRLKTYNAVDYNQMISETVRLLSQNEDVRAEIHGTWMHFLIDEFQDTDPAQMELIDLIAPKNLFVIGDFDQSIYAFRGAQPENIYTVVDRPGCELIHLDTNYRCAISIIHHSNELIAYSPNKIRTDAKPRDDADLGVCEAYGGCGDVWYRAAMHVQELLTRYQPNEIAVLCRDNGRQHYPVGCYGVAENLKALNIPFKRIARDGSIWESYEVRNMIYSMNLIMNLSDRASWSMAIEFPFRRIGQHERIEIKKRATFGRINFVESSRGFNEPTDTWADSILVLNEIYRSNPDQACMEFFNLAIDTLKWRSHFYPLVGRKFAILIDRVKLQMKSLAESGKDSILDFLEWWLSREVIDNNPNANAVDVSTIHGYKGLQKRAVIIPGVDANKFPKISKENLSLDEEIRIFYVAITRAEDECYVLYEEPSQFITWAGFFGIDEEQQGKFAADFI